MGISPPMLGIQEVVQMDLPFIDVFMEATG